MKTDGQRQDQYAAKTVPATVSLKVAAVLSQMKTGFSSAVQSLAAIEAQCQGLLNDANVPTIDYPIYYNFAREIWAKMREGIDGPSLASVAQSLHDKYESYGAATATLQAIADELFNITVA
jgi:hypothetical protein